MLDSGLAGKMCLRAGLVLACLGCAQTWAADICKWKDRDGVVHYATIPPAMPPCLALIRVEHADPVERERSEQRLSRQLEQLKAAEAQREKAQQVDMSQAQRAAERAARCADARDELRFLQEAQGMRLVRPGKEREGEALVWLDDDAREALLQDWREQVKAWCDGIAPPPDRSPARAYGVPPPR